MLKAPDPGPNYAKLMEEYTTKKGARLPTRIDMTAEPDKESTYALMNEWKKRIEFTNVSVVEHAYRYFQLFKGLIVDLIFSFRERNEIRDFFQHRTAEDAVKLIEVELNFNYEVFYTKVVVVPCCIGYFLRVASYCSVLGALVLFILLEKHGFKKFDIGVTYTLLLGAIAMDAIALFMLIFSDWTTASLQKEKKRPIVGPIIQKFQNFKNSRWFGSTEVQVTQERKSEEAQVTLILYRRWSESVLEFNLMKYFLKECLTKFHEAIHAGSSLSIHKIAEYLGITRSIRWGQVVHLLGVKDFLDDCFRKYVTSKLFTEKLWSFIFRELRKKSDEAWDVESTERICSARGAYVLQQELWERPASPERQSKYSKLMEDYIEKVTYDQSLLLWHIATELCYKEEVQDNTTPKRGEHNNQTQGSNIHLTEGGEVNNSAHEGGNTQEPNKPLTVDDYRSFCKLLSEYML